MNRRGRSSILVFCAFAAAVLVQPATAQHDVPKAGPGRSAPTTVYYELGLNITSHGKASKVIGTVPMPIDWPEQTVTVITERKSDNMQKFSYRKLTESTRQLVIKAHRLAAGEQARGSVLLKIEKRNLVAPRSVAGLQIATRLPSPLRNFLNPSPYIESQDTRIKEIAASIQFDEREADWENVERIYQWVRRHIRYQFDAQIRSCADALKAGHGDCEELTSIFIAICRAKGIPARAVWIPNHTYPEFYLQDENGDGHWFPCQLAGPYEFGAMTERRPVLQKGDSFELSNRGELLRYVRPTLEARDAPRGLAMEFVCREIVDAAEIRQLELAQHERADNEGKK